MVPVPVIAGFTYIFIRVIQPKYAAVRSTVGKVNSRIENNLGGIGVIKSANDEVACAGRLKNRFMPDKSDRRYAKL